MAATLEYENGDNWGQIYRKILQNLSAILIALGGGPSGGSTSIGAAQISQPAVVTVSGVDIAVLAANTSRRGFTVQNSGQQACFISLATVAAATGIILQPGGQLTWDDPKLDYTGPVRARWNGTSTTLQVMEVNRA